MCIACVTGVLAYLLFIQSIAFSGFIAETVKLCVGATYGVRLNIALRLGSLTVIAGGSRHISLDETWLQSE